jgi:hypothetical protein
MPFTCITKQHFAKKSKLNHIEIKPVDPKGSIGKLSALITGNLFAGTEA